MSFALTFTSLTLVAAVVAFLRERRLRRALQLVLRRLIQHWRPTPHEQNILSMSPTLAVLLTVGCSSSDERLARFAEQATERQAEQNRQVAELQQQVAEGSRKLVEADAAARTEFAKLQRELQSERSELGTQRDALEAERREIASQRASDPIIAAALMNLGLLVAGALPLFLCWYLLRQSDSEPADTLVAQVLLSDLVADQPLLLAPPPQRRLRSDPGTVPQESEQSPKTL